MHQVSLKASSVSSSFPVIGHETDNNECGYTKHSKPAVL